MSNGIQVAKQIEHSLGNGMERLSEAQNRDVELLIWENKENAGISNKKLRKTRRCTEQASNFKSRCYGETRGAIPKKPRSLRTPRIRPKLDEVKETMINEDKFSTSAAESKPTFESELRDDASENWNMRIRNLKCGFRRKKHNKIWTLTEVIKLIEVFLIAESADGLKSRSIHFQHLLSAILLISRSLMLLISACLVKFDA
ncbi:uncharacterized protein LOC121995029 [Zingiber officinale]|uniref:uncharacterized protein LOC121995029 n=1 Tax=Zingiber officinale TaxID=94328 RepID=UPI001C4BAADB|nr:uncharacterized protein LOC121995029 [Zingiber officinale]